MNRIARHLLPLLVLWPAAACAQYKMSTQEYIDTYKQLAIRTMKEYHIPASITMAQGLLESGNGGSRLAVEGNNHFGIKCKGSWRGETIHHDDDAKGECFRKYRNAEHSYRDHSKFLTESPRYARLFELDVTDYKGWAYGLKEAGYATNPRYPELLIDLIEKNRLYLLDRPAGPGGLFGHRKERRKPNGDPVIEAPQQQQPIHRHVIEQNNNVRYIVSEEGESFASIAEQYNMPIRRLLRLNDLSSAFPLPAGTAVYISPKRKRAALTRIHTIEQGDSYHAVAQRYGIKLRSLQKMNPTIRHFPPRVGQELRLR